MDVAAADAETKLDEAKGIVHEKDLQARNPLFRFFQKAFSMGVEARGIERVPEDERSNQHSASMLLFWFSVNLVITTVPIGVSRAVYQ